MKKYIKIYMRRKENDITLSFEQAERLFDSPHQLVKLTDEKGNWTGIVINKADIVTSDRDYEKEKEMNYNRNQLPEPELSEEERLKLKEYRNKISENFEFKSYNKEVSK
jgi:hypothetical protein